MRARPGLICAIALAIIVYGSLYPFHFASRPLPDGAFGALLASAKVRPGKPDLIANILLYMPLGFFLALSLAARLPAVARVLAAALAGFLLSAAIEVLQLFDAGRNSSIWDITTNTTGTLVGALAAGIGARLLAGLRLELADAAAGLFAVSWLGYRLAPFVPTLDVDDLKHNLKPLLLAPAATPQDVFRHWVSWLLFAILAAAALGPARHRLAPTLVFLLIEAARVFLSGTKIALAELLGGAAACALWAVAPNGRRGVFVLLPLVLVMLIVEGLAPFVWLPSPTAFHLVPFHGFLGGSILVNVQSLLQKLFLYGGLVWLLLALGIGRIATAVGAAGFLLAIELAQTFLPNRSAEITDPLIALCALVLTIVLPQRQTLAAPDRTVAVARSS